MRYEVVVEILMNEQNTKMSLLTNRKTLWMENIDGGDGSLKYPCNIGNSTKKHCNIS